MEDFQSGISDYLNKGSETFIEEQKETIEFSDLITKCKFLTIATFFEDIKEVIDAVKNEECPDDIKLILAEWLYRKINTFYKPKKEEVDDVCDNLKAPIVNCNHIVLKGLYIHYNNTDALYNLAKYFFENRHNEKYFIIQMLNDVQLIQLIPKEKMLEHFISWIKNTNNYDQQCNLLDVLLRNFPKNPDVKTIYNKMKYGNKTLVDLYRNEQSAHDEDITQETTRIACDLLDWYKENEFDIAPKHGEQFQDIQVLDVALESIGEVKLLNDILIRAKIDNTIFQGGFTIMKLFIALLKYISDSPHKIELIKRLEEEFAEMNGLCSSGYINRFINVLQGFDEKYSIKISFVKQLQSSLCHHVNLDLQRASEEVIAGSYDEEYRDDYIYFICSSVTNYIPKMYEQYGKKDVDDNIIKAVEEFTGIENIWKYENGQLFK